MASDYPTKSGNAAEIDRLALALAKDPGSKAFVPLAEEYGKAGMWQEAVAVLEDGLKVYPGFVTAMVALGRAYDQLNQSTKSKAILEEAVKISPENLRAHRTLAKIYAAQGVPDAARRSCQVILSANPQDQEILSLCTALEVRETAGSSAPSPTQLENAIEGGARSVSTNTPTPVHSSAAIPNAAILSEQDRDAAQQGMAPDVHRHTIVERLEAWLASIRSRRQDRKSPDPPTS